MGGLRGAPLVSIVEGSRAVGMPLALFSLPASPAPSQGMSMPVPWGEVLAACLGSWSAPALTGAPGCTVWVVRGSSSWIPLDFPGGGIKRSTAAVLQATHPPTNTFCSWLRSAGLLWAGPWVYWGTLAASVPAGKLYLAGSCVHTQCVCSSI